MTSDDEGEGGVTIPPKNDDVIYEQPLMMTLQRGPVEKTSNQHMIFSETIDMIRIYAIP